MNDFDESLAAGKVGESEIAGWLKSKGFNVLPVYDIEKHQYSGPAVYTADGGSLIAPDMLVFKQSKIVWVEAKHKTAFSWHRITSRWVTGIDLHHYSQYQEVAKLVDWPIWLMFLHKGGQAKDSAPNSPAGLFAGPIDRLVVDENHRHQNHGKSGMVYWAIDKLNKLENYPLI